MLVNLTPKNNFRTRRERQRTQFVRWFGKEEKYPKSEWVKFDALFTPTKYTGVYNSDFEGEVINLWCKQMAYYCNGYEKSTEKYAAILENTGTLELLIISNRLSTFIIRMSMVSSLEIT